MFLGSNILALSLSNFIVSFAYELTAEYTGYEYPSRYALIKEETVVML